jgi:hypothetical protein
MRLAQVDARLEAIDGRLCTLFRSRETFSERECEEVNRLIDERSALMATRIGRAVIKDGKVRPVDTTPAPLRKGKRAKADRVEKRLRANREAKRK